MLAGCASIAGLDQYSNGCSSGCEDATSPHLDAAGMNAPPDGQVLEGDDGGGQDVAVSDESPDAGCDGGTCQTMISHAATWACAKGGCNAAGGGCASQGQDCYCTIDSACQSGKCVKTTGQNDVSCAGCSGSGAADGFGCQLGSPGIPASCMSSAFGYTPSNLTAAQLATLTPVGAVDLSCAGTVTFNGTTWSGATCSQTLPAPKTIAQTGGPSIDVLAFESLTIPSGVTLTLTGSNAVMIVVFGDATISGTIHADGAPGVSSSSVAGTSGPGGNSNCGTSKGGNGGTSHTSGGGGGGASAKGGSGASGVGGTAGSAGGAFGSPATSPLHGGCPGGTSGSWACTTSGGGGGGAVQISTSGMLVVAGAITAAGGNGGTSNCTSKGCAPGPNGTYGGGGGGGGSGGTIVLEGQSVATAGSSLAPSGGNGGNPDPGIEEKGSGGAGGTTPSAAGADGTGSATGLCGADDENGGGGGGAYGYVTSDNLTSAATSCFCVEDSECSTGACVSSGQCTGTCTGVGEPDVTNCLILTAVPTTYACASGNCSDVASPASTCSAAGVPCWCTSDPQCVSGRCVRWAGCATGACSGSGTADAFHCAP